MKIPRNNYLPNELENVIITPGRFSRSIVATLATRGSRENYHQFRKAGERLQRRLPLPQREESIHVGRGT